MAYLIDTNWIIFLLAGIPEAIALLDRLSAEGVYISVITYMEVYEGIHRGEHPEQALASFELLVAATQVLPVTTAIARRCAELRHALRQQGRRVNSRALDLLIAATALEHGLVLVTHNVSDYRDIPGLSMHRP